MSDPLVSVIITAYNSEKYLRRCLISIASQTLKEFEVIIIDDGSTDNTGTIADEFHREDSRFRVIHQSNRGVAAARQVGLDAAKGLYTIHADSDDWVEPDMLEDLVIFAETGKNDMVICDYWEIFPQVVRYNKQCPLPNDRLSIFGQTLNTLSGSLCNKLIKRSTYSQYNITFQGDINYEEDKLVCLKLLSKPISVAYLNKAFYHYDHTQNTQSGSIKGYSPKNRLAILDIINYYCDISPVQDYFNQAIFYIAYQGLMAKNVSCKDYVDLFGKYRSNILRAKGFPLYAKLLVLCKLCRFNGPIYLYQEIKKNQLRHS